MWSVLEKIAERKISEAFENGEWPDLSQWKNRPLPEDDGLGNVAPDLRMACKVLKNAGYVPEELTLYNEIRRTEELLATEPDEQAKLRQLRRISVLRTRLEARCGRPLVLGEDSRYFEPVVDRLSTPAK